MSISHTSLNSVKLGQLQSRIIGLQNEITSMQKEIRLGDSTITGGDSISINPSGEGQLVVKSEDDGIVLEGSKLVVIEATDTEIDSDEKNAVNKRYVSKYLPQVNDVQLRRFVWNSNSLILQHRSNTTDPWYNGISLLSTNRIRVAGLQFNGNTSTYVDYILGSNSSKSNNNTSIATAGYIDTHYYDKTTSDSNYLAINGTATNVSKIEWDYNNITCAWEPSDGSIRLRYANGAQTIITALGALISNSIYPTATITFGYSINSTYNGASADSTKWIGMIRNVANSTYIANRTSVPYSSVTNLDQLVPSLKVLEDNYLSQMNSTRLRRVAWDDNTIRIQTRSSTSANWTNTISINPINGDIAASKVYIGSATVSGNYVNSIATSSSTIGTSNFAVATQGYVDQYYVRKTSIDDKDNLTMNFDWSNTLVTCNDNSFYIGTSSPFGTKTLFTTNNSFIKGATYTNAITITFESDYSTTIENFSSLSFKLSCNNGDEFHTGTVGIPSYENNNQLIVFTVTWNFNCTIPADYRYDQFKVLIKSDFSSPFLIKINPARTQSWTGTYTVGFDDVLNYAYALNSKLISLEARVAALESR